MCKPQYATSDLCNSYNAALILHTQCHNSRINKVVLCKVTYLPNRLHFIHASLLFSQSGNPPGKW